MKKKTLGLTSRCVETPQNGVFYDVPHLNGQARKASIPAGYLNERVEYAIDQLRNRVNIGTGKHLSIHKKGAHQSVTKLRSAMIKAISVHAENGLHKQSELAEFCKDLETAIDHFKSQHENTLHVTQRFAEMYLRMERGAIAQIFDLPNGRAESGTSPEVIELAKLTKSMTSINEMSANVDQKAAVLKRNLNEADLCLQEKMESVKLMMDHLPARDLVEQFPTSVTKSIHSEYNQIIGQYKRYVRRQKLCESINGSSDDTLEQVGLIKEGYGYFKAMVSYRKRQDLSAGVTSLSHQLDTFEPYGNGLQQVERLTTELKELQAQITELEHFEDLVRRIVEKFDLEEVDTPEAPGQEDTSNDAEQKQEFKSFGWSQVNQQEAVSEARSRLVTLNPLVAILAEAERWHDLHLVLDKMSTADLRACKLSQNCTGYKGARFPKKHNLFKACFPECFTDTAFTKLPGKVERGRQAKRLSWTKKGLQYSEIQAQVRNRIFSAWPLLNDLYNNKMWTELRYILERLSGTTLAECRITLAAYSQKNSPYNSYQEMLHDAFEDVFKD